MDYYYYKVTHNIEGYIFVTSQYSTAPITEDNYEEISAEEYLAFEEKDIYFYKILDATDMSTVIGVSAGGGRITDSNYIELLPPDYFTLCEELGVNTK
jgi:hypothetical protein